MSVCASIPIESLSHNRKNIEASQLGCVITRTNGRCVVHDDEDSGTHSDEYEWQRLEGERKSVTDY